MNQMKQVFLIINRSKNIDPALIVGLVARIRQKGCGVFTDEENRDTLAVTDVIFLEEGARVPESIDAAVVLGGDGSILDAAHRLAGYDIPLIGINFGRIGYMAEIEINELSLLNEVLDGHFSIESRMMLEVSVVNEGGSERFHTLSLNDAVLSNGPVSRLLSLTVYANGIRMQTCLADGMIASTPTGSTAYSLSAGGPIMEPTLDCICLTPICPHSLNNRPVILNGNSVIELAGIVSKGTSVYLTTDGREVFTLSDGDRVVIRKSKYKMKLIRVKHDGFLGVLRYKLT